MATESGKDGKVLIGAAPVADVTSWEFTKESATSRYGSSSTAGFKRTLPGVKMGSGTIDFKWDSAAPSPLAEGAVVTLKLHTGASEHFSVPAVIRSFRLRVDVDTGEVTAGTASFETDGAWTEPTLS
jgi:hypothetical protein